MRPTKGKNIEFVMVESRRSLEPATDRLESRLLATATRTEQALYQRCSCE